MLSLSGLPKLNVNQPSVHIAEENIPMSSYKILFCQDET